MLTDENQTLAPGLYFVATPIGSARDITLRALDVLRMADMLAAEDTRNTRRLLQIHGIALGGRPLVAYHDHNAARQRPRILQAVREGRSVACVSDAGTPLVADPGFGLARAAIAEGLRVTAVPGPSALLAALTVAGLPTDRFFFAGFLPVRGRARQDALDDLARAPGTLVLFENPRRVRETLIDLGQTLGETRQAALCRELTKRFEEVLRGSLSELADRVGATPLRGEVVIVVGPAGPAEIGADALTALLQAALERAGSLRDAVAEVAAETGLPRRRVYERALELERKKG